jgi:hypothetical protein
MEAPHSKKSYEKFCDEWLAAWTGNSPDRLREFYSSDAFYRDPAKPQGLRGDELLPYFKKLLAKNPDWVWERVEVLPVEKGFCLKWKASIPMAEKTIHETGLDIVEMKDGKITRNEVYFDSLALVMALKGQKAQ